MQKFIKSCLSNAPFVAFPSQRQAGTHSCKREKDCGRRVGGAAAGWAAASVTEAGVVVCQCKCSMNGLGRAGINLLALSQSEREAVCGRLARFLSALLASATRVKVSLCLVYGLVFRFIFTPTRLTGLNCSLQLQPQC